MLELCGDAFLLSAVNQYDPYYHYLSSTQNTTTTSVYTYTTYSYVNYSYIKVINRNQSYWYDWGVYKIYNYVYVRALEMQ